MFTEWPLSDSTCRVCPVLCPCLKVIFCYAWLAFHCLLGGGAGAVSNEDTYVIRARRKATQESVKWNGTGIPTGCISIGKTTSSSQGSRSSRYSRGGSECAGDQAAHCAGSGMAEEVPAVMEHRGVALPLGSPTAAHPISRAPSRLGGTPPSPGMLRHSCCVPVITS